VREGPWQAPAAPFDAHALRQVVSDRGVRLATAGYLGHMWELYAMWTSITAFWLAVAARRAMPGSAGFALAFATIASGTVGCVLAGAAADRVGRATVTIIAMLVSGACALVIGALIDAPLGLLVLVATIWGISVVADSAQFSACVTELAPASYVGTALTMQTCLGFLLTVLTIRLVPAWAAAWGWERAFAPLAIGPALGIWAMARLRRLPSSTPATGGAVADVALR
jgi:MFS family permease